MRSFFVFFFSTRTGLATQSESLISRMNLACSSLSTSMVIASRLGPEKRRMDCLTGLASLWTFRECSASSLGIPGMSEGCHAKIFQFSRRNSTSALSYAGVKLDETLTVFLLSVGWTWWVTVSSFVLYAASLAGFLRAGKTVLSLSVDMALNRSSTPKD